MDEFAPIIEAATIAGLDASEGIADAATAARVAGRASATHAILLMLSDLANGPAEPEQGGDGYGARVEGDQVELIPPDRKPK